MDSRPTFLPAADFSGRKIDILKATPVGWYALQFTFSDGHETGVYSYELLWGICLCEECQKGGGKK
ncbi:MAG TPA: hypothetical protein DF383_04170 [Deltaproteobacteria bacterium]|nr:hypothetical protein [Deltaproteobacteria bacterium]